MSVTDDIEQKLNLKIEDLNAEEKATYFKMLELVQQSQLTPEKLKGYVTQMREAVERDLVAEPEFNRVFIFKIENRKQVILKARLHNYLLLEAFLASPARAQASFEEMIGNLAEKGK